MSYPFPVLSSLMYQVAKDFASRASSCIANLSEHLILTASASVGTWFPMAVLGDGYGRWFPMLLNHSTC